MAHQVVCTRMHLFLQVRLPFRRMELRCYAVGVDVIWRQTLQGQLVNFDLWPITVACLFNFYSSAYPILVYPYSHMYWLPRCSLIFFLNMLQTYHDPHKQASFTFSVLLVCGLSAYLLWLLRTLYCQLSVTTINEQIWITTGRDFCIPLIIYLSELACNIHRAVIFID